MKHNTINEIIANLENENVEVNPKIRNVIEEESSLKSTIVKVVSIFGGALAVGFFYLFLYGFFENNITGTVLFVLAILQWGICVLGNYQQSIALREGVFVAFYIGGFYSFFSAIFLWFENLNGWISLLLISLNITGYLFYKSKLTQFVALVIAYGIGVNWLFEEKINYWNIAILWILLLLLYQVLNNEWFLRIHSKFMRARYASTIKALSFIVLIGFSLLNITFISIELDQPSIFKINQSTDIQLIIASVISFLIPLYLMFKTVKTFSINLKPVYENSLLIGSFIVTSFILGFNIHALTNFVIGTMLLIWFFQHRLKRGILFSLLFIILSVVSFYYSLDTTLLVKSILLMAMGIGFLILYNWNKKLDEKK